MRDDRHTPRESRRFQSKGPIVIQRQATPCRAAAKPELDNNVALQARVGIATGQVVAGGLVGETAAEVVAFGDTAAMADELAALVKSASMINCAGAEARLADQWRTGQ